MNEDPTLEAIHALTDEVRAEIAQLQATRAHGNGGLYISKWWGGIMAALLIMAFAWVISTVNELDRDVAVIQGNRFTSADALRLRLDIEREIPPPDVERRLTAHERRLDRLEGN